MAVSCLEQRIAPLTSTTPCWCPFGPYGVAPWMAAEDRALDMPVPAGLLHIRSRSWAGYTPHNLAALGECRGQGGGVALPCSASAQGLHRLHKYCTHMESTGLDTDEASWQCGSGSCSQKELVVARDKEEPGNVKCGFSSGSTWSGAESEHDDCGQDREDLSERALLQPSGYWVWGSQKEACSQQGPPFGVATANETRVSKAPTQMVTTLMLQNLPRNLKRQQLCDELDNIGFGKLYDFCHLPMTFGTSRNKGFAFVNFVDEDVAKSFASMFPENDGSVPSTIGHRPWVVLPAEVQGFEANVAMAMSKKKIRLRNNAYRPLIVERRHGIAQEPGHQH